MSWKKAVETYTDWFGLSITSIHNDPTVHTGVPQPIVDAIKADAYGLLNLCESHTKKPPFDKATIEHVPLRHLYDHPFFKHCLPKAVKVYMSFPTLGFIRVDTDASPGTQYIPFNVHDTELDEKLTAPEASAVWVPTCVSRLFSAAVMYTVENWIDTAVERHFFSKFALHAHIIRAGFKTYTEMLNGHRAYAMSEGTLWKVSDINSLMEDEAPRDLIQLNDDLLKSEKKNDIAAYNRHSLDLECRIATIERDVIVKLENEITAIVPRIYKERVRCDTIRAHTNSARDLLNAVADATSSFQRYVFTGRKTKEEWDKYASNLRIQMNYYQENEKQYSDDRSHDLHKKLCDTLLQLSTAYRTKALLQLIPQEEFSTQPTLSIITKGHVEKYRSGRISSLLNTLHPDHFKTVMDEERKVVDGHFKHIPSHVESLLGVLKEQAGHINTVNVSVPFDKMRLWHSLPMVQTSPTPKQLQAASKLAEHVRTLYFPRRWTPLVGDLTYDLLVHEIKTHISPSVCLSDFHTFIGVLVKIAIRLIYE